MEKTASLGVARLLVVCAFIGALAGLIAGVIRFGVHTEFFLNIAKFAKFWSNGKLDNPFVWPLLFQGPAATVAILILWITIAKTRGPGVESSDIAPWRQAFLLSALIAITMATILDWISIVADYQERYPAAISPATYDATETVTKIFSALCGVAVILSIIGRGKGKAGTVITSVLLLIASMEMVLIEGCRGISY
jgi:hypothetical protein